MGGIGTGNGHRKQAQLNKYLFHFEQSHYVEVVQGTEIKIFNGFEPVGNNEKTLCRL